METFEFLVLHSNFCLGKIPKVSVRLIPKNKGITNRNLSHPGELRAGGSPPRFSKNTTELHVEIGGQIYIFYTRVEITI